MIEENVRRIAKDEAEKVSASKSLRLVIESLDGGPLEADSITVGDLGKDLERRISSIYDVCPIESNKAYEEFGWGNGAKILRHHVFGYAAAGSLTDIPLLHTMFLAIWGDVRRAWPEGSFVMWRRRPKATKEDGLIRVSIRLGSFEKPDVRTVLDGCPLPWFGVSAPPKGYFTDFPQRVGHIESEH